MGAQDAGRSRLGDAGGLEAELARLAGMDVAALRGRFRRVFGRAVPAHLSRALLHRVLAFRAQAAALGDLPRETSRRLERLARGEDDAIALPALASTRPGTLIVREWQGELHRVMVLEAGYAWNGRSLPACPRSRSPSPARDGPAHASSAWADRRGKGRGRHLGHATAFL